MATPQPVEMSKTLHIETSITIKANTSAKKNTAKKGKQSKTKPPPPKEIPFAEK